MSLDRRDGGFGYLSEQDVAIFAYAGSKIDTAHAVVMILGQPSVQDMTVLLHSLLKKCYDDMEVFATESALASSLLKNPEHNQKLISKSAQR